MKILITYYSRTATTRKVAEIIREKLNADIMELKAPGRYALGAAGYIKAGRDAMRKAVCELEDISKDSAEYDLVIIGTPIWGWNVTPPVRAFCREQKGRLKKVAFFSTMGNSGHEKAFTAMQSECGLEPVATLGLLAKEVIKDKAGEKIGKFIDLVTHNS
ncbi:hypothetical protein K8R32_01205 [bacterium]|nr:hypothetical protein [bacterium]